MPVNTNPIYINACQTLTVLNIGIIVRLPSKLCWEMMWGTILPRPRRGCEVLFSPCLSVCVSVCVCVRSISWYFIARLLEEILIWNLYRILIGLYSIHRRQILTYRSKVKVTGTVHCFLKVQSYHKNWAIEKFQFFSLTPLRMHYSLKQ